MDDAALNFFIVGYVSRRTIQIRETAQRVSGNDFLDF